MKRLSHIVHQLFYKPLLKLYLKTDSHITFDGFRLKILKGVFHPKLFFSSTYFYSFIKKLNLTGLHFLEIGSGSGVLSLLAFRKGAVVTALDIDAKAVENTRINFSKNFSDLEKSSVLQSDVFSAIKEQTFDVIVINPPYYFKKITHTAQQAWYCGENGEYFERLFSSLSNFVHGRTDTYMILEENCEIDRIKTIAEKNKFRFELVEEKQIRFEKSFIFRISPVS